MSINVVDFIFLDHMMFLLLKLERAHLFHLYFIADTIFICRDISFVLLYGSHDVLAFEAGAWSPFSSLLHGRQFFYMSNHLLDIIL